MRQSLFSVFLFLFAATAAHGEGLFVKGPDGKSMTVTAAEFAALPHVTLNVVQHEQKKSFEGVPLARLLMEVDAPFGTALRGYELTDVVLITARDGYQVVLALAEVDAGTQNGQVIVADKLNGAALPDTAGPYQLVVESDTRPARSARMIETIEVRRLSTAPAKPDKHKH
jgi:hypothetical protein